MKLNVKIVIVGLALFLYGGLMGEQTTQHWITIKDEKTGLQADFPRQPLEMTFEVPFQNTPPTGQIHFYSVPTQTEILVACTFTSPLVHSDWLQKEKFYQFLETILVPHFFFNPAVFQDQQVFTYEPTKIAGEKAASFQISYHDHDVVKKLNGIAMVKENTLHLYFYLASEQTFDQEMLKRFLHSVK
jgi:hypothetical protein